jgi:hypothetical protein
MISLIIRYDSNRYHRDYRDYNQTMIGYSGSATRDMDSYGKSIQLQEQIPKLTEYCKISYGQSIQLQEQIPKLTEYYKIQNVGMLILKYEVTFEVWKFEV